MARPPLQLTPKGLLSFFDLKSGGQNPNELAALLQPVLDLTNWYIQTNVQYAGASIAAGLGYQAFFTNNAGQWRLVLALTVSTDALGAGDLIAMTPGYQIPNTSGPGLLFPHAMRASGSNAAGNNSVIVGVHTPTLTPPGSTQGVFVDSFTGAIALSAQMAFVNLIP